MKGTDRLDRLIKYLMVLTILAVAVFAFVQSYTHVYSLGQSHHQTGASLRMLPLSVDWVMFAAGLAMLHLSLKGIKHWLPRSTLALGATATLIANIAFGIVFGWETAAISAWAPIALFVVVELGMLLVRTAKPKGSHEETALGASPVVPAVDQPDTASAHLVGTAAPALTKLSRPQASPEPSQDTATIKAVTGSPQESLAGWGQLAGQEPAGQGTKLGRQEPAGGLTGIGLNNRGK